MAKEESSNSLGKAVVLGILSIGMYVLLFTYQEHIVEFSVRTRNGEKVFFLVPIVLALAFSFVHGAFTGYFWDALGVKAKK